MSKKDFVYPELLAAAVKWWISKRPLSWELPQHIEHYDIGCYTLEEIALALEVKKALEE